MLTSKLNERLASLTVFETPRKKIIIPYMVNLFKGEFAS